MQIAVVFFYRCSYCCRRHISVYLYTIRKTMDREHVINSFWNIPQPAQ